jgi:hypothetical protein
MKPSKLFFDTVVSRAIGLVLAAVVAVMIARRSASATTTTTKAVRVVHVSSPVDMPQLFAERAEPVVYRNWGNVSKWTCFGKNWSALAIAEALAHDGKLSFMQQRTPNFVLSSDGQNVRWPVVAKRYVTTELEPVAVFSRETGSDTFAYHAGELTDERLLQDVQPNLLDFRHPLLDQGNWPQDLSRRVVWVSTAGVRASFHHDRSENAFVQIAGRKRWRLVSPVNSDAVFSPFPIYHGSRRQAQRNWDTTNARPWPHGAAAAVEWIADLVPGDLLVTPPFFYHEVEAVDDSVSISVLSPSPEEVLFGQVRGAALAVPLSRFAAADRLLATATLLDALITSAGRNAAATMRSLRDNRYEALGLKPTSSAIVCSRERTKRSEIQKRLQPEWNDALQGAGLLQKHATFVRNPGAAEILLTDLVEELLAKVLDFDPEKTSKALHTCW